MKVYQVRMLYFDDYHYPDRGFYVSPLFAKRDDAKAFLDALKNVPDGDEREWWNRRDVWPDGGYHKSIAEYEAWIAELDVCEKWDGELLAADKYRHKDEPISRLFAKREI